MLIQGFRVRDEHHHHLTLLRGTQECRHDDEVVAVQRMSNLRTSCNRSSVYESWLSDCSSTDRFRKSGSFGCRLTRVLTLTFDSAPQVPNSNLPTTQFFFLWVPWETLVKRNTLSDIYEMTANRVSKKLVLKYSKKGHKSNTLFHCQQTDKVTGTITFAPFFFCNITKNFLPCCLL